MSLVPGSRWTPAILEALRNSPYVLFIASEAACKAPYVQHEFGIALGLALDAATRLEAAGLAARVVSMPAPQLFLTQDAAWRDAVLPPGGRRASIEAGATDYWQRFVGESGLAIGIDRYGESAPLAQLQQHFGFTPEAVATRVLEWAKVRSAAPRWVRGAETDQPPKR